MKRVPAVTAPEGESVAVGVPAASVRAMATANVAEAAFVPGMP